MASPVDLDWPYGDLRAQTGGPVPTAKTRLVPYHEWGNRGPSTVRVWLPVTAPPTSVTALGATGP